MFQDLSGTRFGRWLVKELIGSKNGYRKYLCICDCGTVKELASGSLRNGSSTSCGCWSKEFKREKYTTHGFARSKDKIERNFYQVWQGIRTRCYNPKSFPYKDYGGRGIIMSDEWKNNFENFKNDMYESYIPGLTLERKDVNKNYSKENCIWIPRSEQAKNRRCSIWIETEQGRMTVNEAAKLVGISWLGMYQRVKQNWPKEKLLIPSNFKQRIMTYPKRQVLDIP